MVNLYESVRQKFSNYDCKTNHMGIDQNVPITLDGFPHCQLGINVDRLKKCAVLIILFRKNKQFNILFTIRSSVLRAYPGEICFPGGKFDASFDRDLEDTAFRETYEEIGLSKKNFDLVCQLCPFVSPVGHFLVPFICILKKDSGEEPYEDTCEIVNSLEPNPNEVESIFYLPFSYILDLNCTNERISVLKVPFEWPKTLNNMKKLISKRFDFFNGYLNRIFINLDDGLFEPNKLPANTVLYGINATVILFVILITQNESQFSFKVEDNFYLNSKTVNEYLKLIRFASFILYRNYLIEKKKLMSKI
ncbi:coenzyme A pyrophosphatase [Brachionus plicatilis]|uniref:Coenzyme A pyrophosphatase n=1 Tax=Brachionus plicatilis TaxID=10195 RepID=A0A3M7Q771_BRAPC|nr:coenzyme A pyrophosphatase [Brachionus plicatilis]